MLPAPMWPLAEHASLGQNCFDASIGSVWFCILDSMPVDAWFCKSSFPFHQLVGLYRLEKSAIKLEKMPESALILEKGLPAKICLNTFYTRIAFHEDLWLEAEW